MPRFFIEDIGGDTARITGEDARHIARSLRMREGEELVLCDMKGTDCRCAIQSIEGDAVTVRVLERTPSSSEVSCRITLYQALPKGDKLEFVIQKATELGVDEIVPVVTARCISRPHVRSMEKKRMRMQKIAAEAAKQSGRGRIPEVGAMVSYSEALTAMSGADLPILFYEGSNTPLRKVLQGTPGSIAVMVGSEGGFSVKEAEEAKEAGVRLASLGSRILRCETAPVCGLSAILFWLGEF